MKHLAPQFALPVALGTARAPLTLETEQATQPAPATAQPDLLTTPPRPPAQTIEEWQARHMHGSTRAHLARPRILRAAGGDYHDTDRQDLTFDGEPSYTFHP